MKTLPLVIGLVMSLLGLNALAEVDSCAYEETKCIKAAGGPDGDPGGIQWCIADYHKCLAAVKPPALPTPTRAEEMAVCTAMIVDAIPRLASLDPAQRAAGQESIRKGHDCTAQVQAKYYKPSTPPAPPVIASNDPFAVAMASQILKLPDNNSRGITGGSTSAVGTTPGGHGHSERITYGLPSIGWTTGPTASPMPFDRPTTSPTPEQLQQLLFLLVLASYSNPALRLPLMAILQSIGTYLIAQAQSPQLEQASIESYLQRQQMAGRNYGDISRLVDLLVTP